jgi:hypothetical protein
MALTRPHFLLKLEALPAAVPPVIRLRRLLKTALRTYRFRARSVAQIGPPALERRKPA